MPDEVPEPTQEAPKEPYIPIVGAYPGMQPDALEIFAPEGTPILLLESNAHAALAHNLLPTVKKIIERGTPVIALADNYDATYGTTHLVDQPQVDARDTGVFFLETIGVGSPNADDGNQDNIVKIVDVVKEGISAGLKGQELGQFVSERFSFPEGEKPPKPNSIEQMRAKHEELVAMGLGGITETAYEDLVKAEEARSQPKQNV